MSLTSNLRMAPVRDASVRHRVTGALRDAIFSGRFTPGEPLRELHLAKELNVSQATVREALMQLEHAGLVVRTANRGTVVTKLTREDLRERLSLRVLLEGVAAVEASKWITTNELHNLEGLHEKIVLAGESGDPFAICEADLAFHRYIWECGGNKTLYRMLDQLTAPLFAFISILRRHGRRNVDIAVRSHEPIVAALREGAASAIMEAIRIHIASSYERMLESSVPAAGFDLATALNAPGSKDGPRGED